MNETVLRGDPYSRKRSMRLRLSYDVYTYNIYIYICIYIHYEIYILHTAILQQKIIYINMKYTYCITKISNDINYVLQPC